VALLLPKFGVEGYGEAIFTHDSPAIDEGVDVGTPYVGKAPDLGALEYGQRIRDFAYGF
jgi:hypothetical protein